jgi:uncharacterized protein (TIGR03435 family)
VNISLVVILSSAALAQAVQTIPKFDAADVHVSARSTNQYTEMSGGFRGARYDLRNATMLELIGIAWDVDPPKVVGGPSWLEWNRFDVVAKAPPSTTPETIKLMLQVLLVDRFKLAIHKDTRSLAAFALTTGKSVPKLKKADGSGSAGCQSALSSVISCRNMTMQAFAESLRGMARDYLTEPVANLTGLEGVWDFDLKWNGRSQILPAGADRVTIFDAIDKQLGLTLELRNVPAAVIVVDHVTEKPTPNPPGVAQILPPRQLEFEVAEVRMSRPDETGGYRFSPSGRLEIQAYPLKILISLAWNIDYEHADEMIAGAPKWIGSKQFDILAKTSPGASGPKGYGYPDDDLRMMLRALLIDRFKMKTHYEDRLVNAYTLVAVKPKLKKADPSNRASCKEAGAVPNDPRDANPRLRLLFTCRNTTMAQLAGQLQGIASDYLAYDVVDATGIGGAWDFSLSFSWKGDLLGGADADADSTRDPTGGVSLFDAIKKQLGLKLEMRKRRMQVLVIDHIEEKPSEN